MFNKSKRYLKSKILGFKIKHNLAQRGRTSEKEENKEYKAFGKGKVTISARVIRKDGKIEDLGVIYKDKVKKNGKS